MRILSEEMQVGQIKEVVTEFEGNPGYTIVKEYGEMLVAEGIDYDYDNIETVLIEMPENDYHKYNGENEVAIYEVVEATECDATQNTFKTMIKRLR